MSANVKGIHHITAICGDAQTNVDFYSKVLGMRFLKQTVNYDDPGTYHLYYGDGDGNPGSVLTFFPWGSGSIRGRAGNGQVNIIGFAVPSGSLSYWSERLGENNIDFRGPDKRFDESYISFRDPDGIMLELVETNIKESSWKDGPVPPQYGVIGFYGALLHVNDPGPTGALLESLGFKKLSRKDNNYIRFAIDEGGASRFVDLIHASEAPRGSMGVGVVHHIAFRAQDDDAQVQLRNKLTGEGFDVTPVIDRKYFHSIYFREPAGVICEIATDPPGFTVDEKPEELGKKLQLPPWLEERREEIEGKLKKLEID